MRRHASGIRLISAIGPSVNAASVRAWRYNPRMRCVAVRPVAFEDLGTFESVLREHGFDVEYRQPGVDILDPRPGGHFKFPPAGRPDSEPLAVLSAMRAAASLRR